MTHFLSPVSHSEIYSKAPQTSESHGIPAFRRDAASASSRVIDIHYINKSEKSSTRGKNAGSRFAQSIEKNFVQSLVSAT